MEKQFFEGKENVLHSFDLDFLRGVNLEALYYNIIAYIYDSSKNPNREIRIKLEKRRDRRDGKKKKKKKNFFWPLENRKRNSSVCYLHTTRHAPRSSWLSSKEGIEGTRRRFGRDAWPIIIITGIDGAQLGRAKDRAAHRCVVILPPPLSFTPNRFSSLRAVYRL